MFCEHCGKSLSENQAFCENCGTPTAQTPMPPVPLRKLHCPHCGSEDLYPMTSTETTITSSGKGFSAGKGCLGLLLLGPFGLLCGSCGTKTKTTVQDSTKNYWACRSCGKKFLDIDNLNTLLEQEKVNLGNTGFRLFFAVILALFFGIYILNFIMNEHNIPDIMELVFCILLIFVFLTPFIVLAQRSDCKKRCEELEREKAFLEQHAYGNQNATR